MQYEVKPLTEEDEAYIGKMIGEYAYRMAPPEPGTPEEESSIVFKAEDENGTVVGGCVVNVHEWGRAVLAKLWVDERYRRHGLGSMLIRAAEGAAKERGCTYMCLGTMDYMARPLYEKHGYRVFTLRKDIPRGHEYYSLSKRLDRPTPDYVPSDRSAEARFAIKPGGEADAKSIGDGLARYCDRFVQDGHDYIDLGKKLVDANGTMIAGIVAGVDGDDAGEVDAVWVGEPYRKQGLGAFLLREFEREAKENGAYVLTTYCCDWVFGFFRKSGYIVSGELPDYPRGHVAYEIEKRI